MTSLNERKWIISNTIGMLLLLIGSAVSGLDHTEALPSNHRNVSATLNLMPEARNAEDQDSKNQTIRVADIDLTTERYSIQYSPNVRKDSKKVRIPLIPTSGGNNYYDGLRNVKMFTKKDTYLEALEHSHTSKDPKEGVVHADVKPKLKRREYIQGPVYKPETEYGAPKEPNTIYGTPNDLESSSKRTKNFYSSSSSNSFLARPADGYLLPDQSSINFNDYSAYPENSYGPPQTNYGPPQSNYGPPSQTYGVPVRPQQFDELPFGNSYMSHQQGEARGYDSSAGIPYEHTGSSLIEFPRIDLSWPFALKLNAFTLAKILLKLVLFKMIVKFIAVICLLLFIPKLEIIKKANKDEAEEEGRVLFSSSTAWERLNLLTEVVINSVDNYMAQNEDGRYEERSKNDEDCSTIMCRLRRTFLYKESWRDYVELFKSYLLEEKEIVEGKRRSIR
ncbi:uncharacterized protein LOC124428664 isoform X1 [Vespa crabro]|uniref:uncharacterized protein LOC124428664 isoform X1 n=1 Tax=Vespa crabro TaxID=7445 RepID=UPI001F0243E4|nr:uncharacterized protein LOC124428664 isoform X1 [Vespa crabro]XP_046828941.1 uncharacterized protein LOC124428664 isoform X1 [Vespa crabro]XP_046828942.1 uncharacterized protein LOC124428664 isoform X1 [Vespa crabro]